MNGHHFSFHGTDLVALASGALFWPEAGLLAVSDLHLAKSERIGRRGGAMLPPYETRDTLDRLDRVIASTRPKIVICLGDSFDDNTSAEALDEDEALWLTRLQAGREWIWITGNHDPGPVPFPGSQRAVFETAGIRFRHIAEPGESAEISGHYHPKARIAARGRGISRPCFLYDAHRIILPAFGTYTGGLRSDDAALSALMCDDALAVLTGASAHIIPMPRSTARQRHLT